MTCFHLSTALETQGSSTGFHCPRAIQVYSVPVYLLAWLNDQLLLLLLSMRL